MIRYHSHRERRSRLNDLENRRLVKQTVLIIATVIILVAALILFGIPALIRLAVFIGDLRSASAPVEQTDNIPPPTPQIITLPAATASATLDINGYSESGASVSLYHNGNKISESLVDEQGNFSFPQVTLNADLNRFYVIAKDKAGNDSSPSNTQTVVYDNNAPKLTIDSPKDGQQFYGISAQMLNLSGSTDADVAVRLNDRLLVVSSDGSFTGNFEMQEGDNHLHFTATDAAGNQTAVDLTVKYSR